MTRLRPGDDPVEVSLRPAPAGPVPEQFLWRGRLYVVLDVLARWTQSGGWWRGAAMTALTTGCEAPPVRRSVAGGQPAPAPGPPGSAGIDDDEQQWWRVEAASGRASASSAGAGVYDLCFSESAGRWSLARVLD